MNLRIRRIVETIGPGRGEGMPYTQTVNKPYIYGVFMMLALASLACALDTAPPPSGGSSGGSAPSGETGRVVRVIDGDTIDVEINGETVRVRYLQMNTPERDELCYDDATGANAVLVEGQIVTLVADEESEDRFGRLLRHIYIGDRHVNAEMVRGGFAEVVNYPPNDSFHNAFIGLEEAAARENLGCHPTGIFNDGSYTR